MCGVGLALKASDAIRRIDAVGICGQKYGQLAYAREMPYGQLELVTAEPFV